jgi:PAS domain S-box-containing protein
MRERTGSILIAHDVTVRKQSENALWGSKELLREAMLVAGLGTYCFDIVADIWNSSDILDGIFGIDENFERSLSGWASLIHPEDQEMMMHHFVEEVLGNHQRFDREYRIIRADNGRECWVHGMGRLEFNEQAQPVRMIGTILNITRQKQIEERLRASEEQFRLLFEKSNDAIFITIPEGDIISANPEACRMFGMTAEEFCQAGRSVIIDPGDDRFRAALESRARDGEFKGELNFVRKNGEVFPAEVSSSIFTDSTGNIRATVRIGDISERKRVEKELVQKNTEIEQFIYTVSHDLRSPLVTVKTFLGYLGLDISTGDSDRIVKDMEFINTAADRMESLLNELLDLSRVGRETTAHETVTFQELVGEALDAVAGQIAIGRVDVQVSAANPTLCGDRRRLLQIWQNLLDNALKYMGDQGSPRIEIYVEQQHGDTVFIVCDNGIGLAPEYHEKVFGIFEKLDRKIGGVGMGLTMVKRVVETYGGQIRIESDGTGKGSCFKFTLPGALYQE